MPLPHLDIPDQTGRLAVVTGATGGLGFETALALAGAGATVVLTGRNAEKGADALARIRAAHPKADLAYEALDLGSLASIETFARSFSSRHRSLDTLVNNAGVMMLPTRRTTVDGFEMQFGTNHLGHFALTGRLMPLLASARGARVVTVASIAHRQGHMRFDDLQSERSYNPTAAYGQSKLSNLLFAGELHRRSTAGGWGVASIAAHPGIAATDLIANGMGRGLVGRLGTFFVGLMGQTPAQGALPQIFAATSPDARPGGYYGPTGMGEMRGRVGEASRSREARDEDAARRLWAVSEQLTGVSFPVAVAEA